MAQEKRVYLKKIHLPFEGKRWVAIFANGKCSQPFGTYETKKEAMEDIKEYGLRIVQKPKM